MSTLARHIEDAGFHIVEEISGKFTYLFILGDDPDGGNKLFDHIRTIDVFCILETTKTYYFTDLGLLEKKSKEVWKEIEKAYFDEGPPFI